VCGYCFGADAVVNYSSVNLLGQSSTLKATNMHMPALKPVINNSPYARSTAPIRPFLYARRIVWLLNLNLPLLSMLRAVLFDLDDTLFDHKHSRLCALAALQTHFPQLQTIPLTELEQTHERLLSVDYHLVLDGKLSMVDGTVLRIKRLCQTYLPTLSEPQAQQAGELYNRIYMENRQAVPGATALLQSLFGSVAIGVVTNGLTNAQTEKLNVCQLTQYINFMVTSEEVGYKKPCREIFDAALKRAQADASDAVFVGDSWGTDIVPAYALGMQTIWLNRYGLTCPNPALTQEIRSYHEWPTK
jgi:putative hydrolase of the HAD superfamily